MGEYYRDSRNITPFPDRRSWTPGDAVGSMEDKVLSSVHETYRKLAICLDYVDQAVERVHGPYEKASLVVLEDDLQTLLEECEDYLVCGAIDVSHLESLNCRSLTVLDEIRNVFLHR